MGVDGAGVGGDGALEAIAGLVGTVQPVILLGDEDKQFDVFWGEFDGALA